METTKILPILELTSSIAFTFTYFAVMRKYLSYRIPTWLGVIICTVLYSVIEWYLLDSFNIAIVHTILFLELFMIIILFTKSSILCAILFSIFYAFHHIAIEYIGFGIVSFLIQENITITLHNSYYFNLVKIVMHIITMIIILILATKPIVKKGQLFFSFNQELRTCVYAHSILFIFLLISTYNLYYNLNFIWFSIYQIIIGICAILLYYTAFFFTLRFATFTENQLCNKQHIEILSQSANISNKTSSHSQYVEIKHAYLELTGALEYLLDDDVKDVKEARKLVLENQKLFLDKIPKWNQPSNHKAMAGLLLQYQLILSNNNIDFYPKLYIPESIGISEANLHQIVTIFLENMLSMNNPQPSDLIISLQSHLDDNWLHIKFEHSFENKVIVKDHMPYSPIKRQYYSQQGFSFIDKCCRENGYIFMLEKDKNYSLLKYTLLIPLKS